MFQTQRFNLSLQNKAVKLIRPNNKTSLEEPFQHLKHLMPSKTLYLIIKQIHTFLLQQTASQPFWWLFHSNQLSSFLHHKNIHLQQPLLPRVNSSGKCSLTFVGPNCGVHYQIALKPFNAYSGHCSGRQTFERP